MYQYRIVLPLDDDKQVNVATDLDFNVEGELKWGLSRNIEFKTNFMVSVKHCFDQFFVTHSWDRCGLCGTALRNPLCSLQWRCLVHVCVLFRSILSNSPCLPFSFTAHTTAANALRRAELPRRMEHRAGQNDPGGRRRRVAVLCDAFGVPESGAGRCVIVWLM
jgi:hypothetical protein